MTLRNGNKKYKLIRNNDFRFPTKEKKKSREKKRIEQKLDENNCDMQRMYIKRKGDKISLVYYSSNRTFLIFSPYKMAML